MLRRLIMTACFLTAFAGCQGPSAPMPIDLALERPDYAELAAAQNERVERLQHLYSRGVLEMRWRDEDRRHFEQGDLDLFLALPRKSAFRVGKLGDTYFWFGSDEESYWMFDLAGDQRILMTGRHAETYDPVTGVTSIQPLLLLDLMGLARLPEMPPWSEQQVDYDPDLDAWSVVVPGAAEGWSIRLFIDRGSGLPTRAEALDVSDEVIFESDIRRYVAAPLPETALVLSPRMPTLVDVTAVVMPEGVSRAEIKIALDGPTGIVDRQPMDRVFDLERLRREFRPHREERISAAASFP